MATTSCRTRCERSSQGTPFRVRCEAGSNNRVGVQADSATLTAGQRVLSNGFVEMWELGNVYAKPKDDLTVEVLVFNPDGDEPLLIACIRSHPDGTSCLAPVARGLDQVTP